jgi:exonuclease VII small subunit
MADSEIQIVIKAIDEASATLKKIEGTVASSNKSIQKTTENTGNAFTRTQGALLQLGQAAQSVHNIFETWQRRTIMVENAQDRLENATLRLKQANEDLVQATSKLIDIEKKHERDNLRLEDAQLSLEEAQLDLNDAINQYGKNSLEARRASLNLKNAQLDLADAQKLGTQKSEELATAQEDLRERGRYCNQKA